MATSIINANPIAVTLTRVNNTYVNATNFARLSGQGYGKFVLLNFNLQTSTSIPTGTALTRIGTISPAPSKEIDVTIPSQNSNATILLQITEAGAINIANTSGTATGTGFFRAVIPFYV